MAKTRGKSGKPCSLKLVHEGRDLTGTSAQLAYISGLGGWDAFMKMAASEAIATFVETYHSRLCNAEATRPQLRLVGRGV